MFQVRIWSVRRGGGAGTVGMLPSRW